MCSISWPYETARVLTAAANLLSDYGNAKAPSPLTSTEYMTLLLQYIKQHTATTAVNDTAHPLGSGHVFENLHADLGYWNNRAIMYWADKPSKNQGDDYNHSTLIDLILSGLFGIRPQTGRTLLVNPLTPKVWAGWAVEHVHCKGRSVGVKWSQESGLEVFVDGEVAGRRADLGPLTVEL
jgi:hypothetical protein